MSLTCKEMFAVRTVLITLIPFWVAWLGIIRLVAVFSNVVYSFWICEDDPPSPLILDLDGDGVEADAISFFDHEGDGWSELSSWADTDDGTLVWDRNNDGVINDGSELFGNNTVLSNGSKAAHGFAALADLDDNGDGVIDSSDAAGTELQVMRWTDDNNNGMKDDGEEFLVTLDSLGIESLNTGFTNSNHVDSSGNEHRQVGSYTKADGTTAGGWIPAPLIVAGAYNRCADVHQAYAFPRWSVGTRK